MIWILLILSMCAADTRAKSTRSNNGGKDFEESINGQSVDIRELEIENKGLKSRILILEQTLQDTNAGVEHAANVLRMQCTSHIQKSAALHNSMVNAAQEKSQELERIVLQAQMREAQAKEESQQYKAEIERLKLEISEQHAELSETKLYSAERIRKQSADLSLSRREAGTDPITAEELGESAAELAAACSGRLKDAWTQNEKLMEALEAEKRKSLMLQLQLEQQAANAPSVWLLQ
jgi:hypothetical protein